MPGYRHRYMYYATGLPGWMRFGFSPGWVGQSPTGMGPGATYLTTGMWPTPQAQSFWQSMQAGQMPYPGGTVPGYPQAAGGQQTPQPGSASAPGAMWPAYPPAGAGMQPTKEQEIQFLQSQAEYLKDELEKIKKRLTELEG